jgi:probable HAF family extracellular repeat protein
MARFVWLGAAVALLAAGPAGAASGQYTITELKPPHGTLSYTLDVNLAGQAVGVMTDETPSDFGYRGFFYDPKTGRLADIGGLGGRNTFAVALNDAGVVTGWSQTASGASHAFVYTPGVGMRDLGRRSLASDIGESGNVIGALMPGDHAFVWSPAGGLRDTGAGVMSAFNVQGDVFGSRALAPGMWSPPYSSFVAFPAISGGAQATDGNTFGHAVGTVFGPRERAFFWDGRTYSDLTPPGMRAATAAALNDADNVVGHATDTKGLDVPFLFPTPTSQPVRADALNPQGSPFLGLLDFSSVDDIGHIGGNGRVGSETHAFVLTPPFETQVATVARILRTGLSAASPFAPFLERALAPVKEADATSCFELRELQGSLGGAGVPLTSPQRQVATNAIAAIVAGNGCTHAPPAVPVTVPHVFVRKGERARLAVRVPGAVTIRVDSPRGSRFDIVNVRETGAKPRVKRTRAAGYVQLRVSRLKPGTLRFTVVARKLFGNKATPVTANVS